jgi:hypothetical protein
MNHTESNNVHSKVRVKDLMILIIEPSIDIEAILIFLSHVLMG